jgi:hypothetical protein
MSRSRDPLTVMIISAILSAGVGGQYLSTE